MDVKVEADREMRKKLKRTKRLDVINKENI
jgi:hypothetical protein